MLLKNSEPFLGEDAANENRHRVRGVSTHADFVFFEQFDMPNGIGVYFGEEEAGEIYVDVAPHEVVFNAHLQRLLDFLVLRNKNALLVFIKELRIILFQVSQQERHLPHIALISRLIGGKAMQARSEIISIQHEGRCFVHLLYGTVENSGYKIIFRGVVRVKRFL